jgi:hypothetical protein
VVSRRQAVHNVVGIKPWFLAIYPPPGSRIDCFLRADRDLQSRAPDLGLMLKRTYDSAHRINLSISIMKTMFYWARKNDVLDHIPNIDAVSSVKIMTLIASLRFSRVPKRKIVRLGSLTHGFLQFRMTKTGLNGLIIPILSKSSLFVAK